MECCLGRPQPQSCGVCCARSIAIEQGSRFLKPQSGLKYGTLGLFKIHEDAEGIPYWASQLASTRREVIASHSDRIEQVEQWIVEVQVPCRTLASVFQEAKYPRLDLLAIDVERFDFEVVKTNRSIY